MCFVLFLNVFPCVGEDVVRSPFGEPMKGGVGKGWLGSLEASECGGSSVSSGVVVVGVCVVWFKGRISIGLLLEVG